jgi:hypothetical protein
MARAAIIAQNCFPMFTRGFVIVTIEANVRYAGGQEAGEFTGVGVVAGVAPFMEGIVDKPAFGNSSVAIGTFGSRYGRIGMGLMAPVTASGTHRSMDHHSFRLWTVASGAACFFL